MHPDELARLRELAQTAMSATYGRKFDALEQVTADARRHSFIRNACEVKFNGRWIESDAELDAIMADAALVRGERQQTNTGD